MPWECGACGTENRENNPECHHCGAARSMTRQQRNRALVFWIGVALAGFVVMLWCVFYAVTLVRF
jgi:hypothetical protein